MFDNYVEKLVDITEEQGKLLDFLNNWEFLNERITYDIIEEKDCINLKE